LERDSNLFPAVPASAAARRDRAAIREPAGEDIRAGAARVAI